MNIFSNQCSILSEQQFSFEICCQWRDGIELVISTSFVKSSEIVFLIISYKIGIRNISELAYAIVQNNVS